MKEPLSFYDWCCDTNIEEQYKLFHDEYGDLAGSMTEYKDRHYEEYLENFKNGLYSL